MSKTCRIPLFALVGVLLITQTALAQVARVIDSKGTSIVERAGAAPRILGANEKLDERDTISVARDSWAILEFQDQTRITLRPNTVFRIDAYSAGVPESALMGLVKGGFRAVTGLIARRNPSNVRIQTAVATIGIRGTEFDARLCEDDCAQEERLHPSPIRPQAVARVVEMQGVAAAARAGEPGRVLVPGAALYEGDGVATGPGGYVVLVFRDGARVTLERNSRFAINRFQYSDAQPDRGSAYLTLFAGQAHVWTGRLAKISPDAFLVRSAMGVIRPHGTGFSVSGCIGSACGSVSGNVSSSGASGSASGGAGNTSASASGSAGSGGASASASGSVTAGDNTASASGSAGAGGGSATLATPLGSVSDSVSVGSGGVTRSSSSPLGSGTTTIGPGGVSSNTTGTGGSTSINVGPGGASASSTQSLPGGASVTVGGTAGPGGASATGSASAGGESVSGGGSTTAPAVTTLVPANQGGPGVIVAAPTSPLPLPGAGSTAATPPPPPGGGSAAPLPPPPTAGQVAGAVQDAGQGAVNTAKGAADAAASGTKDVVDAVVQGAQEVVNFVAAESRSKATAAGTQAGQLERAARDSLTGGVRVAVAAAQETFKQGGAAAGQQAAAAAAEAKRLTAEAKQKAEQDAAAAKQKADEEANRLAAEALARAAAVGAEVQGGVQQAGDLAVTELMRQLQAALQLLNDLPSDPVAANQIRERAQAEIARIGSALAAIRDSEIPLSESTKAAIVIGLIAVATVIVLGPILSPMGAGLVGFVLGLIVFEAITNPDSVRNAMPPGIEATLARGGQDARQGATAFLNNIAQTLVAQGKMAAGEGQRLAEALGQGVATAKAEADRLNAEAKASIDSKLAEIKRAADPIAEVAAASARAAGEEVGREVKRQIEEEIAGRQADARADARSRQALVDAIRGEVDQTTAAAREGPGALGSRIGDGVKSAIERQIEAEKAGMQFEARRLQSQVDAIRRDVDQTTAAAREGPGELGARIGGNIGGDVAYLVGNLVGGTVAAVETQVEIAQAIARGDVAGAKRASEDEHGEIERGDQIASEWKRSGRNVGAAAGRAVGDALDPNKGSQEGGGQSGDGALQPVWTLVWDGEVEIAGRTAVKAGTMLARNLEAGDVIRMASDVFATVPRPDQVKVDSDLFRDSGKPIAEGLYVWVRDGEVSLTKDDKTVDVAKGNAAVATRDDVKLLDAVPNFMRFDPTPVPTTLGLGVQLPAAFTLPDGALQNMCVVR
jgi:hypothetical protein